MKKQLKKNKNKFDSFIRYSSLAFEMMAIIALGTFLGFKIDQWMNNEFKGFTLGLMILSVIGSVAYAIRNLLKK
ncbi:Putative F0F1-ATPase subunit Ca2+/Mg2+ transporter [Mariniphaga anaerophila]|uniref:Putative F0F1-ATPase subunit Ca2+/Mg2+ transporter n=1 Tax=Mariniphaga anaerophila TaxID=1484053 RepID=A0A1M5CRE1_9BACT|nr:AtpZ/AtpI family protein [Mariniphaga anaerophila]SHF57207.1 Putative F0F1-ATPase subunit Ca2+/Mg2+ transporter [Mariniphaga anaerophila]